MTLEEALLQALLGFGFRDGSGSGSGAGGSREEQQQQEQRAPHGRAGGAARSGREVGGQSPRPLSPRFRGPGASLTALSLSGPQACAVLAGRADAPLSPGRAPLLTTPPPGPAPQLLRPTPTCYECHAPRAKPRPNSGSPAFICSVPIFRLFSMRLNLFPVTVSSKAQLYCLCSHSTPFAHKSAIQWPFTSLEGTIMVLSSSV